MYANLCPHTVGMSGLSQSELIALASQHGFGGADLMADALGTEEDADRVGEAFDAANLRRGLFVRPADFFGDRAEYDEGLERMKRLAPLAARAGGARTYDHVWPGSNDLAYDENFRRHVERLKPVAAVCAENGIRFGLEFIGPKTLRDTFTHPFIHRLDQMLELIDAVGEGVGLVLDMFHWYTSGGTLDALRGLPAGRLVNVHLNDARAGRGPDEQMDMEREMPLASGLIDARGFVGVLREAGYDGPVIVEPFQPSVERFGSMAPADVAQEAADILADLLGSG